MEAAVQFHSAFWEDGQVLKIAGLPLIAAHYREHLQGLEKEFAAYKKQWEGRQDASGLKCFDKALELLANRDIHTVKQRYLTGKNMTLIHGDLHPGNMFISALDHSVRMIDFEAMRMGVCTDDLAMLAAYHIAPGKQDAMLLLRHYHAHLAKMISGYSFDEFISDYGISILENLFFSIRLINQGIPAFNIRDASLEAFRSFIPESAAWPLNAISHTVSPMTVADAAVIAAWAYPPPYDIYSMGTSRDIMEELMDGSYYVMRDGKGALTGFYCFGASARVPAGIKLHAYDKSGLMDIGLGMAPALCGKGFGLAFLNAGLAFAREEHSASAFRLSVAAFNKRAIRVYEKAGFQKTGSFLRTSDKGCLEFIVMVLKLAA
jgi:RimJ/RimL family protein N-acetyltransferase